MMLRVQQASVMISFALADKSFIVGVISKCVRNEAFPTVASFLTPSPSATPIPLNTTTDELNDCQKVGWICIDCQAINSKQHLCIDFITLVCSMHSP